MSMALRLEILATVVALVGCAPPDQASVASAGTGGTTDSAGDALPDSGPLVVSAIELDPNMGTYRLVNDGDSVSLLFAPQGGHVLFIGVRVRNLDSTKIELSSRILDPTTKAIVQQDIRDTKMVAVPGEPGLLQTDSSHISLVSNIALCPDYNDFDIVDQPYVMQILVTEENAQGSTGSVTLKVTPMCPPGDGGASLLCNCECHAGYTLGKCSLGSGDAGLAP